MLSLLTLRLLLVGKYDNLLIRSQIGQDMMRRMTGGGWGEGSKGGEGGSP